MELTFQGYKVWGIQSDRQSKSNTTMFCYSNIYTNKDVFQGLTSSETSLTKITTAQEA